MKMKGEIFFNFGYRYTQESLVVKVYYRMGVVVFFFWVKFTNFEKVKNISNSEVKWEFCQSNKINFFQLKGLFSVVGLVDQHAQKKLSVRKLLIYVAASISEMGFGRQIDLIPFTSTHKRHRENWKRINIAGSQGK